MKKLAIGILIFVFTSVTHAEEVDSPLTQTNLYTKIATRCESLILSTWTHPTRQVLEKLGINIKKVELCNNKKYPIFSIEMKFDPSHHSEDKETKKYFGELWSGLMKANGWNPLALIDLNGNMIVYLKKSNIKGVVELEYEGY